MRAAAIGVILVAGAAHAFQIEQLTCVRPGCTVRGAPALTGDGGRLFFRSDCDLEPGRNPRHREQLFRLDLTTRTVHQLSRASATAAQCRFQLASDHSGDRVVAVAGCGGTRPGIPPRWRLFESRDGGLLRPFGPWVGCAISLSAGAVSADGAHLAVTAGCPPTGGRGPRRRLGVYLRDGRRSRMTPLTRPGCALLDAALDRDGRSLVFLSDCDLGGENAAHYFQAFRLDRTSGVATQLSHVAPDSGCALRMPLGVGLFAPPALSADGAWVALGASCVEAGRRSFLLDPAVVFRWGPGGERAQLTHDYCVTEPRGNDGSLGLSAVAAPVALSADGTVVAFTMTCGVLGPGTPSRHVFVLRAGPRPRVDEILSAAGRSLPTVSAVALDAAGTSLALVSDAPLAGCPAGGAAQLYLVHELAEPRTAPARCACGALPNGGDAS